MTTSDSTPGKRGLALSGGGHRAAFFHIGVLSRLADLGFLRGVRVISTVSGGSIVGALYYLHVKALLEAVPDESIEDAHFRMAVESVEQIYRAAAARNLRGRALLNYRRNLCLWRPSFSRTDRVAELYDEWFFRPVGWTGEAFQVSTDSAPRIDMRCLLIEPRLLDGSKAAGYDAESPDNNRRRAPVPILLLNATTLNTGHNWRFEATHVGEPQLTDAAQVNVDHNLRLIRSRYEDLPTERRAYHLGTAVAASAAFPGGFAPKAITELFEATTEEGRPDAYDVELTDGGVSDNQGVDGLLDFGCDTLIVSDAGAQMADVAKPPVRIPAVLSRVGAIARRSSRVERMLYAETKAQSVSFMHMQTGLPVRLVPPIGAGPVTNAPSGEQATPEIPSEVQRLLALMRTDLDAFSDLEAFTAMLAGYRITKAVTGGGEDGEGNWPFSSVADRFDTPDPAYLRRLRISPARFFKPLLLAVEPPSRSARAQMPRLVRNAFGVVLAVLVGLALVLAGVSLAGKTVHARVLYGVVVAAIVAAIAYVKADLPGLRTLSRLLYDSLVPFALAVLGVFSAASALFVFEGWLHRGLGRLDGVRDFLLDVGRTFVVRVVPWVLVALGIPLALLAGAALLLDAFVNKPSSLEDLTLAPRLIAGIGIGAALAAAGIVIQIRGRAHSDLSRALATGVGIAATPVLLGGALVATALVMAAFGHRGQLPQSLIWAHVTLILIALAVGAAVFGVMTASLHLFARFRDAEAATLPLGVFAFALLVVFGLGGLRDEPKTDEALRGSLKRDLVVDRLGRPDVRYDAMLVIDPRTAAGRRLVGLAQDPGRPLLAERTDAPRSDTAFGVAVVTSAPTGWLVLQQPTTDRARLATALAGIESAIESRQPASYGPALLGLVTRNAVQWRRGAVHSVTIVADRPPAPKQLRRGLISRPPAAKRLPSVIRVITPRPPRRADRPLPAGAVTLNLVVTRGERSALDRWTRWTAATGGVVLRHRQQASPLDEAEDAVTRAPPASELELATAYRPLLLFDSKESRPPLDVDAFLAERHDGTPQHSLCDPQTIGEHCDDVQSGLELARDFRRSDRVLRIDADPAAGDEFPRDGHQRIYYHLVADTAHRIWHIDYWIFYRFNDSPRLTGVTCLAGLAIADATCFDHEGDWEGVTVTLGGEPGAFRPVSVAYATHKSTYRFGWPALAAAGATEGHHPKVWVARGSHASYPMPCGKNLGSCHELGSDIPDGRRDGHKPWRYNDSSACRRDHCVIRLPLTRNGGPASWAAFGGLWGEARCTNGLKLCVRSGGPSSPFFQTRYGAPGGGKPGDRLLERRP
jgi:predicted acylesterase/phospholipase RssA